MPAPLYPNPPLEMVILEVRHPRSEISAPAHSYIKAVMSGFTPIERLEATVELDFSQAGPVQRQTQVRRLVSRDRHTSVSFREEAIVVEASVYQGWEWLRSLVSTALTARHEVVPLDGLERVGLRYIDEIRPTPSDEIEWGDWVSADLLAPSIRKSPVGMRLMQQQSVAQYETATAGQTFTLRYGVARGAAVVSSENLRRLKEPPSNGEFFLIDTDAAWVDPTGAVPEFDHNLILRICDDLHAPIKLLFESLITDKLRDEVLAREI
ncbi:hypothetical protein CH298_13230 [Rhodococcoides fascians]|uniref:TIGR04255 family protein n=1 Tax=Rhodococcoides fascians TaxID=1828 RepID=UPI000B9A23A3|nr:TIGR04255 family protein [Rhodococcus fascians]OZE89942.1 hypothetical protein CH303_13110 [Rhodococcus fascians]OZF18249.1 hypothetical protein CH298_13230 [Rhodococcus fascians]OZF21700.1 hypothetical protein CH297_13125 [Rhodococcus fascians]OZF67325.1 hypothetical protein CH308_13025 [Rhodococcus fascians]OZF70514.1 hypothetical protein CH307_13220 [Rhodococcus fascians]